MDEQLSTREGSTFSSDLYGNSDPEATHHPKRAAVESISKGKRKASYHHEPIAKRVRIGRPAPTTHTSALPWCAGLPPEIWQHVFLHLEPVMLGRLVQVNRAFKTYLTDISGNKSCEGCLYLVDPKSIWSRSRATHFRGMGKPTEDMSEKGLWKLVRGKRCQFCGKLESQNPTRRGTFDGGPGPNGVRIVWPFGVTTCGSCLEKRSQNEIKLLFTSDAALLPALPYAFVTRSWNYVPSSALRQLSSVPPEQQLTKVFFLPHLQRMRDRLHHAQNLGDAAAQEWVKGLEKAGHNRRLDAEKWEKWEANGQLDAVRANPEPARASNHDAQAILRTGATPKLAPSREHWSVSPQFLTSPSYSGAHVQRLGSARNLKDANEAKAIRRAEIESRCQQLYPPIRPEVLRHIDSFQAAIKISAPLTDGAWEVLRPRLEAQRESAERIDADQATRVQAGEAIGSDDGLQEPVARRPKDAADREWEEAQAPVYSQLAHHVDSLVESEWAAGKSIARENVANFVAQALIGVRHRFWGSEKLGLQPSHNTFGEAGSDVAIHPEGRALVLGHMKWTFNYIFDTHVKTQIPGAGKELFLCNGCGGNSRPYAFEGLVLHYGAKHTSAFSVGNTVVSWRTAEWPEEPPFHPHPGSIMSPKGHATRPLPGTRRSGIPSRQGRYAGRTPATPAGHPEGPFPLPPGLPTGFQSLPPPPASQVPLTDGVSSSNPLGAAGPSQHPTVGLSSGMHSLVPESFAPERALPANHQQAPSLHDRQVQETANIATYYWDSMARVHPIPSSVRIGIIFVYLIREFYRRFESVLSLAVFEDALYLQGSMAGMRDTPGLNCRVCDAGVAYKDPRLHEPRDGADAPSIPGLDHLGSEQQYSLASLISHSTSVHTSLLSSITPRSGTRAVPLQFWVDRFMKRPSEEDLVCLLRTARMDARERNMIESAFEELVPPPSRGAQETRTSRTGSRRLGPDLNNSVMAWIRSHVRFPANFPFKPHRSNLSSPFKALSSESPTRHSDGRNRISPARPREHPIGFREDTARLPMRRPGLEDRVPSHLRGGFEGQPAYYDPEDENVAEAIYYEPQLDHDPSRRRAGFIGDRPPDRGAEHRQRQPYSRSQDDGYANPSSSVRRRTLQHVRPQHRRYLRVYQQIPNRSHGEDLVRSSSRYGRYEAQRRRIEREWSTSVRGEPSLPRSVRHSAELSPRPSPHLSLDNDRAFRQHSPGPSRHQTISANRARTPLVASPPPPNATPVFDFHPDDQVRLMYPADAYPGLRLAPGIYPDPGPEEAYEYVDNEPMSAHPEDIHFAGRREPRYLERRAGMPMDEEDHFV